MKYLYQKKAAKAWLLVSLLLMTRLFPHVVVHAFEENSEVPKLITVLQIAPDTLKITFDKQPELKQAIDPGNYWVQDLDNANPLTIASYGKDECPSSKNTLAQVFATITPDDLSNQVFLIKFNDAIAPGTNYRLYVCFITSPDGPDYTGENGTISFTGK